MDGTQLVAVVLIVIVLATAAVGVALIALLLAQKPHQQFATPTPSPLPFSIHESVGIGVHYRSVTPSALARVNQHVERTAPRGLPMPPRYRGGDSAPRVVVHSGPLRGTFYPLAHPALDIGRGNMCTIILPDLSASRRHVRIEWHSDGLYLVDMNSTNGTFVNGRRVGQYRLQGGEQVKVGNTFLTIQLD